MNTQTLPLHEEFTTLNAQLWRLNALLRMVETGEKDLNRMATLIANHLGWAEQVLTGSEEVNLEVTEDLRDAVAKRTPFARQTANGYRIELFFAEPWVTLQPMKVNY